MHLSRHPDVARLIAKRDMKGLLKALGLPGDAVVRAGAATALGAFGDPAAVVPLVVAVGDDQRDVRLAAVAALGRLGGPGAVAALAPLLGSSDLRMCEAALAALVMIGAASVDSLAGALKDRDSYVRARATKALGEIGGERAVEPLTATLHDRSKMVRQAAADALDGLGWAPPKTETGAAYWVAKRDWRQCAKAAAVEPLIAVLHDEDEAIRHSASRVLVRIGAPAVQPLVDSLGWNEWEVESVLVEIGAPAVEPLVAHLHDEPEERRRAIVGVLGKIADARAVESLLQAVDDPESSVRDSVATALGHLGDARSVEPLIGMLDDGEASVRRSAANALGRLGDARAVPPLVATLREQSGYVRRDVAAALDALGWIPDTSADQVAHWIAGECWEECVQAAAVEPLMAALVDEIRSVREGAAETLGRIADPRSIDALAAVLNDDRENIDVCKSAAKALVAMYRSGKLDEEARAKVLAQRAAIMFEEPERDELRFGSRVGPDRSIGVYFPL
jgi:HEAT repeat protein